MMNPEDSCGTVGNSDSKKNRLKVGARNSCKTNEHLGVSRKDGNQIYSKKLECFPFPSI